MEHVYSGKITANVELNGSRLCVSSVKGLPSDILKAAQNGTLNDDSGTVEYRGELNIGAYLDGTVGKISVIYLNYDKSSGNFYADLDASQLAAYHNETLQLEVNFQERNNQTNTAKDYSCTKNCQLGYCGVDASAIPEIEKVNYNAQSRQLVITPSSSGAEIDHYSVSVSFYESDGGDAGTVSLYGDLDATTVTLPNVTKAQYAWEEKMFRADYLVYKVTAYSADGVASRQQIFSVKYGTNQVSYHLPGYQPADLTVSSCTVSANPTTASTIKLSFKVQNKGKGKAAASKVFVYDGSTKLGEVSIAALAAGKSVSKSFTIAKGKLSGGKHVLKLVADGEQTVEESSENNNTCSKKITVKRLSPDLTITKFSASGSISTTQSLKLKVTVKNQGKAAAGASRLYLYDGKKKIGEVALSSLGTGKSVTKNYTIAAGTLSSGKHSLKWVADGAKEVSESNEKNNTSSIRAVKVTEKRPDLKIIGSSLSSGSLDHQPVTVKFTVKNAGKGKAAASKVYLYDGDVKLSEINISSLGAGKSVKKSCVIDADVLSAGTHTLRLLADGSNAVREISESNNFSRELTVDVAANDPEPASLLADAATPSTALLAASFSETTAKITTLTGNC